MKWVVRLTLNDFVFLGIIALFIGWIVVEILICVIHEFANWIAVKFLRQDKTKKEDEDG